MAGAGTLAPGLDCLTLIIGSTENLAFMESSRHKFYRFMMRIRSTRFYASSERFIWKTSSKPTAHLKEARRAGLILD